MRTVKTSDTKRRSCYLREVIRLFLICFALGILLVVLKTLAYDGYLGSAEFELDLKIWAALSAVLSIVSPALELAKARFWDVREK